ncbi:hypothetical protein GCM10011375_31210 [Hymenobacter qilianensis]|uniref:Uncharacterized protein n=2 Tax=Hymenobacter qilianensis TaxID=1385715 RepID=A0A7H0GTF8_9BACT|nr:hypothetical protein [Hymenobacter qilianensis]QNP51574.1 hypothetical protein H9L05_16490 [Hymenobacter qilianensis]GGF73840.1 hypothetical protein GCM10011375_31210 [Hymenobacter qilianensis]
MSFKRYLFFIITLLVVGGNALAQAAENDPLLRQIREREQLMRAYEQTSAQRNGLFGKKASKKDLNQVNAALRRIIRKDTEILEAVRQRTLPKLAQVEVAREKAETKAVEATNGQYKALENQIEELQIREMAREKLEVERETRLLIAQAAAAEAEQVRTRHEMLAIGLALFSAGLLGYILWQRRSKGKDYRRAVPFQHRSRPLAE